jgi:hypothetical protein
LGLEARFLLLTVLVGLGGCMPRSEPAAKRPNMHNSRNSLDWTGAYEGVPNVGRRRYLTLTCSSDGLSTVPGGI